MSETLEIPFASLITSDVSPPAMSETRDTGISLIAWRTGSERRSRDSVRACRLPCVINDGARSRCPIDRHRPPIARLATRRRVDEQLVEIGLRRRQIERLARTGTIVQALRGAYRSPSVPFDELRRARRYARPTRGGDRRPDGRTDLGVASPPARRSDPRPRASSEQSSDRALGRHLRTDAIHSGHDPSDRRHPSHDPRTYRIRSGAVARR